MVLVERIISRLTRSMQTVLVCKLTQDIIVLLLRRILIARTLFSTAPPRKHFQTSERSKSLGACRV